MALLFVVFQSAIAERLPLKSYTTADGLAHNEINRIVRDSRGFIWFCTAEGLSRFDGYGFTNYGVEQGLPDRRVNDFLETRVGEIWVATNSGLVRFDPKGTPMSRLAYANEAKQGAPPMFTVIVSEDDDRNARVFTVLIEARDGTIYCGTLKHLYRLARHGERFELVPVDIGNGGPAKRVAVLDLLEDHRGSLWLASFSGVFRRQPDGRTEQFTKSEGLPDNNIHDLLLDHQGRVWAGTRLGGFFRFAAQEEHTPQVVAEVFNEQNGLQTDWVFQLFETSDHRFWLATNKGLVEFFPNGDGQGRRFHTYTRRNGLSFQEITALNEDTGGNLWLGTIAAGAMKLARNGFVTYGEQDGLVSVNSIFEDAGGGVCFRGSVLGDQRDGAFDGQSLNLLHPSPDAFFTRFGRFDGQRFEWFKPGGSFDFGWVAEQIVVQTIDGEWWVGSGAGLYRFPSSDSFEQIETARPLAVYTTKDGLAAQQLFRVFADSGGNVWASAFGLARWDRASQTLTTLANAPNLPSVDGEFARSFGEDRAGNIWVGFSTGIARYRDGRFTFFTASSGLPPGAIMNIYSDHKGRLWLASSRSGVIRLDDPTAERPVFTSYTTAEGLSSNSTDVITEDLQGRMYISTGHGVDQLDPETGRFKHFTIADGLAPGNIVAAFRDSKGTLWFGTHRGLSRFAPTNEEISQAPAILITGLSVANEPKNISAIGETEVSLPDIEPERNQLQINFVALSFVPGEVLRYQYKLEGSDADWSLPTEQRSLNLASLAPGNYRFLVRAISSSGIVSASPSIIRFAVLRPVWQRWWFLLFIAAVITAIAYTIYRLRLTRIVELANVRTRIATDLHDDIGAKPNKDLHTQ
ncbi:MAG: hypothetical protein ND895_07390 [Pyrinomonadaceae bacterium]|nr:hypothetical protein [Pyrinomonadaceae bacterium]